LLMHMNAPMTPKAKLKVWAREVRAPFFTAAIVPTLLGTAIAWYEEAAFNLLFFALTLAGTVLAHAGTNVVNDYFDFKSGTDRVNRNRTTFNGGSPFILEGLLTPREVYTGALVLFGACACVGFYLAYEVSYLVFVLGVIGCGFGYFYTSPKVNLAGRGLGEFAVGMGFGPIIVVGAYLVQTGVFSWTVLLEGLPVGFLIGLVLFINQFPDMEADKSVGKNHWVARMGLEAAALWYVGVVAATFTTIVALWLAGVYPLWTLVALLPALVAVKAVRIVLEKRTDVRQLVPAQAMTIQTHLLVGLLLTAGFLVATL